VVGRGRIKHARPLKRLFAVDRKTPGGPGRRRLRLRTERKLGAAALPGV